MGVAVSRLRVRRVRGDRPPKSGDDATVGVSVPNVICILSLMIVLAKLFIHTLGNIFSGSVFYPRILILRG